MLASKEMSRLSFIWHEDEFSHCVVLTQRERESCTTFMLLDHICFGIINLLPEEIQPSSLRSYEVEILTSSMLNGVMKRNGSEQDRKWPGNQRDGSLGFAINFGAVNPQLLTCLRERDEGGEIFRWNETNFMNWAAICEKTGIEEHIRWKQGEIRWGFGCDC